MPRTDEQESGGGLLLGSFQGDKSSLMDLDVGKTCICFEVCLPAGKCKTVHTDETPDPVEQSRYLDVDAVLICMLARVRNSVVDSKTAHVGTHRNKCYNHQRNSNFRGARMGRLSERPVDRRHINGFLGYVAHWLQVLPSRSPNRPFQGKERISKSG